MVAQTQTQTGTERGRVQLRITIDLDDELFQSCDGGVSEVERLLDSVSSRIPDPLRETDGAYSLHDMNGNWCGEFCIQTKNSPNAGDC